MLRRIYEYLARPDNTGVGVDNLALVRPYNPPLVNPFTPAYMVRGTLARCAPAMMKTSVFGPTVTINGTSGLGLQGQISLAGLSQKQGS